MSAAPREATAAVSAPLTPRRPRGSDPDEGRDWFDRETIVDLPAPAASFAAAEAAAADYRRATRADNTRRAYRAAVAAFTQWCAVHQQTALLAAPETVAAFLAAEAGKGLAVNTLRLRQAALRYLHLLAGFPRQPHRRWSAPPLLVFAVPTAGPCAKRPPWCSTHCAPQSRRFPTVCPGGVIVR